MGREEVEGEVEVGEKEENVDYLQLSQLDWICLWNV